MNLKYRVCLSMLLSCLWMAATTHAQEEAYDVDDSVIPERPPRHIFDPAKWLNPEEEDRISIQLADQLRENEIDVYIVTRAKQPVQGAKTYARTLGEAWTRAPVWCVIFYVPGDPSGFHVQAGGIGLDPARVNRAVAEASKRAKREMSEKDRVMAAWVECAEVLRFMHNARDRNLDAVIEQQKKLKNESVNKDKWKRIIIVSVVSAIVILLAGAWFILSKIRKKRCPAVFEFPETSWRIRYLAPYSGGSGLEVSCKRKKKPTKSQTP